MTIQIERVKRPTAARFTADYAAREQPVILTGVIDDWPARGRWSLDYFASKVGTTKITVMLPPDGGPEGYYRADPKIMYRYEKIEFGEFVRRTAGGTLPSLYPAGVAFPFATEEIGSLDYLGSNPPNSLWISAAGTTTPLHYDSRQNMHALVTGRKRFTIFDRKDFSYLYPHPMFSSCPHISRVHLRDPDLEKFPRLARAKACEVTLEAGEMLFLPPGWWHEVDALAPSISVSFWGRRYGMWTRSYMHGRLPSQLRRWARRLKLSRG